MYFLKKYSLSSIVKTRRLSLFGHIARMNDRMLAVSSSNHRQRSGRNLVDGHTIPGSGLLPTTWQTPTLGFRKQERQLRTGSTGGCLRSIAQRTRSGACSYWTGLECTMGSWAKPQKLGNFSRIFVLKATLQSVLM